MTDSEIERPRRFELMPWQKRVLNGLFAQRERGDVMPSRSSVGEMIPVGFSFAQERSEPRIRQALRADIALGTMDDVNRTVEVQVVMDGIVVTHKFTVVSHEIRQMPATKADMRFADRVRKLFAEKEEGIEE